MEIGGKSKGKKKDRGSSSTGGGNEKDKDEEKPKQYFFDLRWTDFMNPTVRQQSQDVCWALAVAGAVEGRYNMSTGDDVEGIVLAPQVLIDGVTKNKKEDHVASTKIAFAKIKKDGLCKEGRNCKFLGNVKTNQQKQEADKNPNLNRNIFVGDVKGQPPYEGEVDEDQLYECLRSWPVVGFLKACSELLDFRGPGIYYGPTVTDERGYLHAVVICGAGRDEDGNCFWFIKNSYGTQWGDGGYGKVARLSGPGKSLFIGYSYADIV